MKKGLRHILPLLTAALLTLTACTHDSEGGETGGDFSTEAITFSTDVEQTATRAAYTGPISSLDALKQLPDGFGIYAYFTDGQKWQTAAGAKATNAADYPVPDFMTNQPVLWQVQYVTKDDKGNDEPHYAWQYSPLKYWPNSTANAQPRYISFFGYAPHTDETAETGITGFPSNSDKSPHIDYKLGTVGNQVDLLWACQTDQTRNGQGLIDNAASPQTYQKVELTFRHALAMVDFYVIRVYDEPTSSGKSPADEEAATRLLVNRLQLKPGTGGITTAGTLHLTDGSWTASGAASAETLTYEGACLTEKLRGAQKQTAEYIIGEELYKWAYHWTADGTRDDENGTYPTGITATEERLLGTTYTPLFIPQTSLTFTPILTYTMLTRDNELQHIDNTDSGNTFTDAGGNKYFRLQQTVSGQPVTLTFEPGKRYRLLLRIGVEHIAMEVAGVEDWDFPMRFNPDVEDWKDGGDRDKTLNEN